MVQRSGQDAALAVLPVVHQPGSTSGRLFEMTGCEVDEGADPYRHFVALGIDHMNLGGWSAVVFQHLAQSPAARIFGNVPFSAHQDAVPVERPGNRDFAVAGVQVAAHLDAFDALACTYRQTPKLLAQA